MDVDEPVLGPAESCETVALDASRRGLGIVGDVFRDITPEKDALLECRLVVTVAVEVVVDIVEER